MNNNKLYNDIEQVIIKWVIDGTKTASSLTRETTSIVKQQNNG